MAIKLPAKVLPALVMSQTGVERWPYDDGQGDKWWSGGTDPRFYTWDLTLNVTEQTHSSHLSRDPFKYNAFDIKVGDWIANVTSGLAVKVIGTKSKSATTIIVTVEDINRYNTFRDKASAGDGSIGTGSALVFTLNEEGEPLTDTIAAGIVSEIFFSNIMGRFQNLNAEYDFNLTQIGHTFAIGDTIAADPDTNNWVKATSAFPYTIGQVTAVGPTPDQFYFTPMQRVIDDLTSLPGVATDLLYADDTTPGAVTTVSNDHVLYVKLREESATELTSEISPVATTPGSVISLNGQNMTFAIGTEADVVSVMSGFSGTTGVTVTLAQAPTIASTQAANLGYGVVGAIGSTSSASINGLSVVFDIVAAGTIQFGITAANAVDMAAAITRDVTAVNSNIIAYEDTGELFISDLTGAGITLTTLVQDGSGFDFEGTGSTSGIFGLTSANTDSFLNLVGSDAGPITFDNVSGTPMEELGLYTVENGKKAAALYVEHGIAAASSTVVADISARNALSPGIGDQAMVLDKGNGEWELYLYDGSIWIPIANEDSARTDANSIEYVLNFNGQALGEIVTVSNQSRITLITIEVVTPFDGTPTLTVGVSGGLDSLFSNDLHDLSAIGTYASQTDTYFGSGIDTTILAQYIQNGATQGQAKIIVSYM